MTCFCFVKKKNKEILFIKIEAKPFVLKHNGIVDVMKGLLNLSTATVTLNQSKTSLFLKKLISY